MANRFIGGVFSPINIGREGALALTERLSAVTHVISSAEYLSRSRGMESGSWGDWAINRDRFTFLGPRRRRLLDFVSRPAVTRVLHVGRLTAGGVLILPTSGATRAIANGYLAMTSALLYPRHHYGTDGSDQVVFHTSTAAFAARVVPGSAVQDAALWYVALQSGLSYLVSGGVKMFGPSWRSGRAVPGVMRTMTYGSEPIWRFFAHRPRLATLGAHFMLLGECLFAMAFVSRGTLTRIFVVGAGFFHLGIGFSMGLGRFVTAFGSMLPAVAYATNRRSKSLAMPKMVALAAASVFLSGLVAGALRHRRVLQPPADSSTVRARRDERLSLRFSRAIEPGVPLLLLEHGMLSTPEHFAWLSRFVGESAILVTFCRRGYGSSDASPFPDLSFGPDELLAAIDALASHDNPLFVGGHSLGGYLARLAAERRGDVIDGVVYLDSTHPGQFERSTKQEEAGKRLENALVGIPTSLRLGLGWLLAQPSWILDLPKGVRHRVLDQYRNHRLWRAGLAEWCRAKVHFASASNKSLSVLEMPALVVAAGRTLRADDLQSTLNRELAEGHAWSTHVVVIDATHDSILTREAHAKMAAESIREFLRDVRQGA